MSWTSPATPVSGSVITVSFYNTNVRDNLNWLRLLTGNADPPGTNYVCVSVSSSNVTWQKIPGDAIAAGSIQSSHVGAQQIVMSLVQRQNVNTVLRGNGPGADVLFGQVQLADIVVGTADRLIGSNGTSVVYTQITGPMVATGTLTADKIGAQQIVMSLIQRQTANTVMVGNGAGADVSFRQIVAADLATAVSAGLTPSGMIAGFETAAAIPSGWTRYTAADGRLLVGAGAAGSPAMSNPQTFTQATNYGSDWAHTHSNGSLESAAGTTGGPSTTFNAGAGGTGVGAQAHLHNYVAAALTGAMGGTVWLPALRAIVWAQRT